MEVRRVRRQGAADGRGVAGAEGARLWVATAPTRDFRAAKWEERKATVDKDGTVVGEVGPPKEGCLAVYGDLDYRDRRG